MTDRWQLFVRDMGLFLAEARAELSVVLGRVSARLAQAFTEVPVEQAIWAGTVAAASLVVTTLLILFVRRRGAGRVGKRSARVRALASRGLDDAEISRQTGLSRDAVSMLLGGAPARRGRRNLPLAARIADEETIHEQRTPARENPQAYTAQRVTGKSRPRRFAAHRLLDRIAQSLRIPRYDRAA